MSGHDHTWEPIQPGISVCDGCSTLRVRLPGIDWHGADPKMTDTIQANPQHERHIYMKGVIA